MMHKNERWIRWRIPACLLLCIVIGCAEGKESLHELDHELPPHWPTSMSDAAAQIEERITLDSSSPYHSEARGELEDLVSWIPEIAADTDLTEADWLPIYELSETLRKHLAAGDVDVDVFKDDFKRLQSLLRDSEAKLPILNTNETSSSEQQHDDAEGN